MSSARRFGVWEKVGLGLEFAEVQSRDDAEIRIGFMRGDGAWSYVGRDVFLAGRNERTMNFGWDIRNDIDTPVHEIGHTLGFPHEHQNPNAGHRVERRRRVCRARRISQFLAAGENLP